MKIKTSKEALIKLLAKTQNIVEKRNTMPVLVHVLLEAQNNKLKVMATNLEVSMTDEIECEVQQPGRCAVNAKSLFDIIKEMPEGAITLARQDNNWLKVTQNKSIFNIVGVSPDEYPVFPTFKTEEYMQVDCETFADMIAKTIYSVSNDETRYHLNGVYFEKFAGSKDEYLMVATDGHRLSLVNKQKNTKGMAEGVIIPRKGLLEIFKILEGQKGHFQMAIEGSQLVIKKDTTMLMIRLIEGKYPNYKQLIPENLNEHVSVRREHLLSSLKRVSLLSNQKSKGVTFNFSKNKLEITSNNPELGEAKEEIEVDYSGAGLKIGFNAKYIIDILNSIHDEQINIDLKDQLSPGVMRPAQDKSYTCVVMPMRI